MSCVSVTELVSLQEATVQAPSMAQGTCPGPRPASLPERPRPACLPNDKLRENPAHPERAQESGGPRAPRKRPLRDDSLHAKCLHQTCMAFFLSEQLPVMKTFIIS